VADRKHKDESKTIDRPKENPALLAKARKDREKAVKGGK
jgi:hypothetical protein